MPVYELLLQLIESPHIDSKQLRPFIGLKFVQEFVELFSSEEPKEREYLKNTLHRLYSKLVPRRKMIRKVMTDMLSNLIHADFRLPGAAELLDILASIISGFAVPLRDEHIYFFKTVIIPLHKVQTCLDFHKELLRCAMLFVSKDSRLSVCLVEGLLRYWPFANFNKEVKFLQELLEVLDVCDYQNLEPLVESVFRRVVRCMESPHLQVCDTALSFFEHDFFISILRHFRSRVFPFLVPAVVELADNCWHKLLQDSMKTFKKMIRDLDPVLFDRTPKSASASKGSAVGGVRGSNQREIAEATWSAMLELAKRLVPDLEVPVHPYQPSHIVGEHNGIDNGNAVIVE